MPSIIMTFKMAWRNLRRHFRRSAITIASLSLGLAVILWLQCILAGQNRQLIETIATTSLGHLQIFDSRYVQEPQIQYSIPQTPTEVLKSLPASVTYTNRLHIPALASTGEQSIPILLEGIDPVEEVKVTKLKDFLKEGEFLKESSNCESKQAFVGKAFSQSLGLSVGQKFVVLTQATDGTMGNELFRVTGLFDTGSKDFDRGKVYTTLDCAGSIGVVNGIHEITLKLADPSLEEKVRQQLSSSVGEGLVVRSWRETLPRMHTVVKYNDSLFVLISIMLFILITLGIINTLLISVFERTREFGLMIALGTTPKQVIGIVLAESLVMSICATIIGCSFGIAAVFYHKNYGFDLSKLMGNDAYMGSFKIDLLIRPDFSFIPFLKVVLATLVFVLLASLIPALKASRMSAAEAMRSS